MSLTLRRLLNYLPFIHGGEVKRMRASWHKPTPFDQWRSQPPFRPLNTLRADYFGRSLRRRRLGRAALRWVFWLGVLWVVVESIRAMILY